MIIDADVHITPFKDNDLCITAERLIEIMDEAKIDKARAQPHSPYIRTNLNACLKYVYEAAKKYPARLLGFGWVDPSLGMDDARDTVKRCLYEYGFYGIKFNGALHQFFVDDPKIVFPLVEEIAKAQKIVAFHSACDAYEKTHPYRVMHVAKAFPDVPILMVHMGGAAVNDLSQAAIEAAQQCPNITLVGSEARAGSILKAIKTLGANRVCFGSDTPFEIARVELAKYHALLDGYVTQEEKDMVLGKNIERIFSQIKI